MNNDCIHICHKYKFILSKFKMKIIPAVYSFNGNAEKYEYGLKVPLVSCFGNLRDSYTSLRNAAVEGYT